MERSRMAVGTATMIPNKMNSKFIAHGEWILKINPNWRSSGTCPICQTTTITLLNHASNLREQLNGI